MIEIKNISKVYGENDSKVTALNGINLQIKEGEFTAIMGKSGSGKSTLLNLIGTLETPTSGEIFINGINICKLKGKKLASFRNNHLGYIFQSFYLESEYSVLENVMVPLIIKGVDKKEREEIAYNMLSKLGIKDKALELTKNLSGGQQQRVVIARALVNNPTIILADEPTGNLDSVQGKEIVNMLKDLTREGKTVVMVTHDETIKDCFDRIIYLKDGIVS